MGGSFQHSRKRPEEESFSPDKGGPSLAESNSWGRCGMACGDNRRASGAHDMKWVSGLQEVQGRAGEGTNRGCRPQARKLSEVVYYVSASCKRQERCQKGCIRVRLAGLAAPLISSVCVCVCESDAETLLRPMCSIVLASTLNSGATSCALQPILALVPRQVGRRRLDRDAV